jgi:hypothetical protein
MNICEGATSCEPSRAAHEVVDVVAGGIDAAGAQEHVRGDVLALLGGIERCRHGLVHGPRQRVLLVGAHEPDHLHPALDLDLHVPCHALLLVFRFQGPGIRFQDPTLFPDP